MLELLSHQDDTLSITGKRWVYLPDDLHRLGLQLSQSHGIPDVVGTILATRGCTPQTAEGFLNPRLQDLMPDPSVLKDVDKVTERLVTAIRQKQRIAIFGDYDVDGATSSALLGRYLRFFGIEATIYIPDRMTEGYGPNVDAMRKLSENHDLIVTVDCGTVSFEPVAAAKADVIIIDHHQALEEIPDCIGVVNPNRQDETREFGYLCAAGVVFLVLVAVNRTLRQTQDVPDLRGWLDLVALGTVADVAPLVGLNRAFVQQGLKVMARRHNTGLRALSDTARLDGAPTPYHLGYVLGPRINAGGRIGNAGLGTQLLMSECADTTTRLAMKLDQINEERRAIEKAVLEEAIAQVESRSTQNDLIWAYSEDWHPGVVGIVASRLKEKYQRPAIVIGAEGKGSGRSVEGIDLGFCVAACVKNALLLKGGGHEMAAGLTACPKTLDDAMSFIEEKIQAHGINLNSPKALTIMGNLSTAGVTLDLCTMLEHCGPYGAGAPSPRFCLPNVRLTSIMPMGESHLRLTAQDESGKSVTAVAFQASENGLADSLNKTRSFSLVGKIERNDWKGRQTAQFQVEDAAGGS
jgi:single-stranded-DNA-specific exonuclease